MARLFKPKMVDGKPVKIRTAKTKQVNRSRGGTIFMFFVLILFAVIMVAPLYFTVITAFKPINEVLMFPPKFYVMNPTTDNFTTMFRLMSASRVPFSRYLFNSVFVSVTSTVGGIIVGSLAAYPLAKHRFKGKTFIYNCVVWAMMFRQEIIGIPQYLIIAGLGMINTYWSIILPSLAGTLSVFLMRQFITANVPDAIIEAAKIDGAKESRIFWRIVMPNVKPAWLTLAIFQFQSIWNQTGGEYIYDEPVKMLPTAMRQIVSAGISRQGAAGAVALFLMLPTITLFICSQSSIMETMSTSGLK